MISTLLALSVFTSQPPSVEPIVVVSSTTQEYQEDLYQIEITPGSGTVSVVWNDRLRSVWGSSYATSTEYAFLYYQGVAKAAGNVYQTSRIIEVSIWYTRNGSAISSKVCSDAYNSGGVWRSGSEVSTTTWDVIDWNAPKTIFNISTVRIPPNTIP